MAKKEYHQTTDGKFIELKDLTDQHLANIIRMIERKAKEGMTVLGGTYGCSAEDMDAWVDEIEGDEVFDHFDYDKYKKEQHRRTRLRNVA